MSTYHLSDAVRPLVDWTTGYAVRRRLWPAGPAPAGPLTPRDAAHVIRTIDVVCDDASPRDLPFEHFAALDELGASLADGAPRLARSDVHGAGGPLSAGTPLRAHIPPPPRRCCTSASPPIGLIAPESGSSTP